MKNYKKKKKKKKNPFDPLRSSNLHMRNRFIEKFGGENGLNGLNKFLIINYLLILNKHEASILSQCILGYRTE